MNLGAKSTKSDMQISQTIIKDQVAQALAEDVGSGDITAALIEEDRQLSTRLLLREQAVICGIDWFNETFLQCDPGIEINWQVREGSRVDADTVVCSVAGPARALLTAERTAINFLQTLSGTASTTNRYARLIKNTSCKILDTRKTIPNLRLAQKYAVACGGGFNHRIGLFDAYLIKENHLQACGGVSNAVGSAKRLNPDLPIEVEVENLEQLQQAIDAGAQRALLDNFSLSMLEQAVTLADHVIELEASGNIDETSLLAVARTGVDFISIGALTKHISAIDFSLRYDEWTD